jgi:hypothetical protein
MSKLIEVKHPYQINNLKNLDDYLISLKHLTNIIQKEGFIEKKDGISIPLRWSIKNNCFVVDRGTDLQRDIEGISIDNINHYELPNELKIGILYTLKSIENNKQFYDLCFKYGLIKNEQRFIAFEFVNGLSNKINNNITTLFPIGLFIRSNSNLREGIYTKNGNAKLIDNSNEFCYSIYETNKDKFSLNNILKTNRVNLFEDFIKYIKNISINLFLNDIDHYININSYLQENLKINFIKKKYSINNKKYSNFSVDLYKQIKNNNIKTFNYFNEYKNSFICLYLNELYGEFLKNNLLNKETEGLVVLDKQNNILYKFTGDFNLLDSKISIDKKEKNKVENNNINVYNSYLLPRCY